MRMAFQNMTTEQRRAQHHSKFYFSSLIAYFKVLILPIIVGIVFYVIAINETQNYALEINSRVLQSAAESIDLRLQEVDNIGTEIINNAAVQYYQANKHGFEYPYSYRIIETRDALSNYSLTQRFISDYFIFFNNSKIVLNGKIIYTYHDFLNNYLNITDYATESIIKNISNQALETGLLSVREITIKKTTTGLYLLRIQPLQGLNDGYLLILINQDALLSMFASINLGSNGAIFILNNENVLLCHTSLEGSDNNLFDAVSKQMKAEADASAFYMNSPSGQMLVNRFHSNSLTYISVQPLQIILARVNIYRNIMIGSLIGAILIGIALCFRQANRISSPVSAILSELDIDPNDTSETFRSIREMIVLLQANNENLGKIASEHKALLRSSFSSRLLQGDFSNDSEAVRVCEYVLPGYAHFQSSCVLLLRVDVGNGEDSNAVKLKMLASMKIALKNEIDKNLGKSLYYDVDEKTLAWILFNLQQDEIDTLYAHFYQALPLHLQNSICTFGGSLVTQSLRKISRSYDQARIAMLAQQTAITKSHTGICWVDSIPSGLQYFLPADMRNGLVESVRQGDSIAVKQILDELFQINYRERPIPYQLHNIFIYELISIAMSCLLMLTQNRHLSDEAVMEQIAKINDAQPQEQQTLLYQLFSSIAESEKENQRAGSRQFIQQVKEYLKVHFQEADLSLSCISDHFKVNISSLSTVFKQQTGNNLSNYLEDLRIREAQHLLRTSNLTINQIADTVGYPSANTFCRAFRRNTGSNTSTYKSILKNQNT